MTMPATLAEQAVNIFDKRGEFAMIAFIMARISPREPPAPWLQHGLCTLEDLSTVLHHNGRYHFSPTPGDPNPAVRTAAMRTEQRPEPMPNPTPLFTRPNFQSVWNAVIEDIETDLGLLITSPIICNRRSYRAAPGLYAAIQHAITEFRNTAGDDYPYDVDEAVISCAQRAFASLDAKQQQALIEACRHAALQLAPDDPIHAFNAPEQPAAPLDDAPPSPVFDYAVFHWPTRDSVQQAALHRLVEQALDDHNLPFLKENAHHYVTEDVISALPELRASVDAALRTADLPLEVTQQLHDAQEILRDAALAALPEAQRSSALSLISDVIARSHRTTE